VLYYKGAKGKYCCLGFLRKVNGMKNSLRLIALLILITGSIGYGALLVAAQDQERQALDRLQDKQRVASLSTDELRYELDLRWQKLHDARVQNFPAEKLFACLSVPIKNAYVGTRVHGEDYIKLVRGFASHPERAILTPFGRGLFLQTGRRQDIRGSGLAQMGGNPNADRRYFDCVYDLTLDTEIAAFGHIYELTPQEETDIKTKAQADPLVKK